MVAKQLSFARTLDDTGMETLSSCDGLFVSFIILIGKKLHIFSRAVRLNPTQTIKILLPQITHILGWKSIPIVIFTPVTKFICS